MNRRIRVIALSFAVCASAPGSAALADVDLAAFTSFPQALASATPADPARDAMAGVGLTMLTRVTRPDGSVEDATALDHGIPVSGVVHARPSRDMAGYPRLTDFPLSNLRPGDLLEFRYDYAATASTRSSKRGVLAAIGERLDWRAVGARLDLQPGAWRELAVSVLLAVGLTTLVFGARSAWSGRARTRGPAASYRAHLS